MKGGTAKLLLSLAAGGATVWGVSRWRNANASARRDRHDDRAVDDELRDEAPPTDPRDGRASEPAARAPTNGRREPSPSRPGSSSSKPLARTFDTIFMVHGMGLPVPYLRALAAGESRLDPLGPNGLFNIRPAVREDFNARHGTDLSPAQLKNPLTSVMIAADTLRRIIDSFATHHPDVENLREDWTNRAFVELLTLGWVGGWSETAGLGRVAAHLERQGQTDITITDIARAAYPAGAAHGLWDPRNLRWTRTVADLYLAELGRDLAAGRAVPPAPPTGTSRTSGAMLPGTPAPEMLRFGRPAPENVRLVVSSGWARPRAGGRTHRAIDLPVPLGTPVLAIDDGVVVRAQATEQGAAGKWVAIKHPSGITSRSLHLSRVDVRVGQQVKRGERLGLAGNTGDSAGPHLHLDLRAPRELLALIESWVGRPAGGWGPELKPYGYSIPGETWIPVDDYAQVVKDEAAAAGIRLHGEPANEAPLVASAAPVSSPSEVDGPVGG